MNRILTANIDVRGREMRGRVAVAQMLPNQLWVWSRISRLNLVGEKIEGETVESAVYDWSGELLSKTSFETLIESTKVEFPNRTTFACQLVSDTEMQVEWMSYYASEKLQADSSTLRRRLSGASTVKHAEMEWGKFREYAEDRQHKPPVGELCRV